MALEPPGPARSISARIRTLSAAVNARRWCGRSTSSGDGAGGAETSVGLRLSSSSAPPAETVSLAVVRGMTMSIFHLSPSRVNFRGLDVSSSLAPRASLSNWASTKAAYRFFANPRVEEGEILSGHFDVTKARYVSSDGSILLLQDPTELTYQRPKPHDVGFTKSVNSGWDANGRLRHHAVCGILMHSSLVVTEDGLPLGLAAVKFWNREKFRGTAQLRRKINPTRMPIETKESIRWLDTLRQSLTLLGQPERCVHIGDRESDVYELYCLARERGTHFVVRTVVDRLAGNGDHTAKSEMTTAPSAGTVTQSHICSRPNATFSNYAPWSNALNLSFGYNPPSLSQYSLQCDVGHTADPGREDSRQGISTAVQTGPGPKSPRFEPRVD